MRCIRILARRMALIAALIGGHNIMTASLRGAESGIRPDAELQAQIKQTFDAAMDEKGACDGDGNVYCELKKLKELSQEENMQLVQQLAYFAEGLTGGEQELVVRALLELARIPDSDIILALAPHLDAGDAGLKEFVRDWFQFHDMPGGRVPQPPLQAVRYGKYLTYIQARLVKNEPVPDAFVKYIFDRFPGKALLVFAYAQDEAQDRREGPNLNARYEQTSDIIWSEHIVSDAIWRKQDGFGDRFEEIRPQAVAELEKLSKHDAWWARLYVAVIVRQHPELAADGLVERLRQDEHELVREALDPNGAHR